MKKKIFFSVLFQIIFLSGIKSQGINGIMKVIYSTKIQSNNSGFYYIIDSTNILNINQIDKKRFFKRNQSVPNFGIQNLTVWSKFIFQNESGENFIYLNIDNSNIDEITCFIKKKTGFDSTEISNKISFYQRPIENQNATFPIFSKKGEFGIIYLRIRSSKPIIVPVYWGNLSSLYMFFNIQELIFGIYTGLILVMFLYNLFLFISVKDLSYFYFSTYVIFVGLTQASLLGYGFRFLWPKYPQIEIHSSNIIPALVGIASIFFVREFLNTKISSFKLDLFLKISLLIYLLVISLDLFGKAFISQFLVQVNAFFVSLVTLFISFQLARQKVRKAQIFFIAWIIFLVGILFFVLRNFNFIPETVFLKYVLIIGSGASITLLSFALADNINTLKKEKEESQAQVLNQLEQNENLIRNQNIYLENQVELRTTQLTNTMDDLNVAMDELKNTQSQLVESEKLASLGQLTAGIAHEINNPINFVTSNINPLKRDIEDLYVLMDKMEDSKLYLDLNRAEEISKLKKDLDIDFIKTEIDLLLKGIEEGAHRTSEIIRGLKNFARVDEQDLKEVDINEGIESTLLLLRNKTKEDILIETDLQKIPPVQCYAGKMNQVFMNIISNSIYAVNNFYKNKMDGHIYVQTKKLDENRIQICIKDNGPGIPQKFRIKIFEPFFTTKPVGEGTGLGLSIVRTIIESHHGEIILNSSPETGTEFLISLPITQ